MSNLQIQQEVEEVQLQKQLITENTRKAETALQTLQELTGFDFSSALRGIAIIEDLTPKMTKPVLMVNQYDDLKNEVAF